MSRPTGDHCLWRARQWGGAENDLGPFWAHHDMEADKEAEAATDLVRAKRCEENGTDAAGSMLSIQRYTTALNHMERRSRLSLPPPIGWLSHNRDKRLTNKAEDNFIRINAAIATISMGAVTRDRREIVFSMLQS